MNTLTNKVIRPEYITRAEVRKNRHITYVFGDNMHRVGMGGQAGAMRGEPNAVGIPTKWAPGMAFDDFFRDADWDNDKVYTAITSAFTQLKNLIYSGYIVAIPKDGLGTGLSELPQRAPRILAEIEKRIAELEAL